jgi:hypothetical protein
MFVEGVRKYVQNLAHLTQNTYFLLCLIYFIFLQVAEHCEYDKEYCN